MSFTDFFLFDFDAIGRFASLEVAASRKGPYWVARAQRQFSAGADGSLGAIIPPCKVIHRIEKFGGVVEEKVLIYLCICYITPVHAITGKLGLPISYPLDLTDSRFWPTPPPFGNADQLYIRSKIHAAFTNGPPVAGLDPLLIDNINRLAA